MKTLKLAKALLLLTVLFLLFAPLTAGDNFLEVKCVDAAGAPINKVKVFRQSVLSFKRGDEKSDKQGIARFKKLDDGFYRVWARTKGFEPALFEFIELKGGAQESITLKFMPGEDRPLYFEDQKLLEKANQFFIDGSKALQDKQYDVAEGKLRDCLAIYPSHPDARYNLAFLYMNVGRWDEAEAELKQTVELLDVFVAGEAKEQSTERYRADQQQQIREMLDTLPVRKLAFAVDQAYKNRDYEAAVEPLSKLLEIDADNANAHYMLAQSLVRLRRFDEAESRLSKALALEPDNKTFKELEAQLERIRETARQNEARDKVVAVQELNTAEKYAEAIEKGKEALNSVPDDLRVHVWSELAKAHLALEQYPQAFEAYQRKLELGSEPVDQGLFELGEGLVRQGKQAEARAVFEKVLQVNPEFAEAYYQLGMDYFYEAGDKVKAKQMLEKYIELGENEANVNNAKNVLVVIEKS